MNNHETLDPLQQRIALLALAATQPTNDAGACPGDAQLTAFIEHRLTGAAREAMLYHLNRCPTCYQVWLDTVEVLQDEEPTPVQQPETHQEIHWWQRLLTLTTWRPQLVIPVTAVAMLAGVLLLWPGAPTVTEQIDAQYKTLRLQPSTHLAVLVEELPLPWRRAALGFSTGQHSPSELAFGAGLWVGVVTLGDENADLAPPEFLKPTSPLAWPDSEWAAYYQTGRWMVLLWTLAQSVQPNVDWSAQGKILETLKDQLTAREANEPAQRGIKFLVSLAPLLNDLARQDDDAQRDRLGRRLEVLMQQMMSAN